MNEPQLMAMRFLIMRIYGSFRRNKKTCGYLQKRRTLTMSSCSGYTVDLTQRTNEWNRNDNRK